MGNAFKEETVSLLQCHELDLSAEELQCISEHLSNNSSSGLDCQRFFFLFTHWTTRKQGHLCSAALPCSHYDWLLERAGASCPAQASGQEGKSGQGVHAMPSSRKRSLFTAPFWRLTDTTALPHILRGVPGQKRHRNQGGCHLLWEGWGCWTPLQVA